MCGISGIISLNEQPLDLSLIAPMTDKLSHRGPDGEGFLITNSEKYCEKLRSERQDAKVISIGSRRQLAMGHRRLSILDLHPEAAQPMADPSGRYWIVFNGEIYNHQELRQELVGFGYRFNTDHSDTEVILNAYSKWGSDCLSKFNGMWAFCIWDKEKDEFFIARDRVGKKPFYYAVHNRVFYFASELKAILVNRDVPRQLDERAIYDYLTYTMVPSPATIFRNIKKLPAGHFMKMTGTGDLTINQYWFPSSGAVLQSTEADISTGLRNRLMEAARIRYIADVEVGALLSGGVDSSVNLACLSMQSTRPVRAFSVGFENKEGYTNEFKYARQVAKQFNADYHELMLTEREFIDFMPEMVYYQDEPIADPANIPIYYISKVARQNNVKVLLGGEGSDELFAGYSLWPIARQFAKLVEGRPGMARLLSALHRNTPLRHKRKYYMGWYEKVINGQPAFWSGTELRSEKEKRSMLSAGFRERLGNYSSFEPFRDMYRQSGERGGAGGYRWMTTSDLLSRLPDLLLARLDRMTMAASLEARTPFLDINVIDYAMRIPDHLKYKNGQEKYILKKAFEGILPHEVIYRRKDSFTVPMTRIFSDKRQKEVSLDAIAAFGAEHQLFSKDFLERQLPQLNGNMLWNLSNLSMWYLKFR